MATPLAARLGDVDIRLLRVYVAVAESGGVTGAALTLNLDPSTISRQLTELETRLGLRLCERSRAGFWLTEEGRAVLSHARTLLAALRDFSQHIGEIHKELEGEFAIAVADTIIWDPRLRLPAAIGGLKTHSPKVEPMIEILPPDDVERAVAGKDCHIGLMPAITRRPSLKYDTLYQEENALYAVPGCPAAGAVDIQSLMATPVATVRYESRMAAMVQKLGLKAGPRTNTTEGVAALIRTGLYLGYFPTYYGAIFEARGELARLAIADTTYEVDICAVTADSDQPSTLTNLFLGFLK
ncbi:MAG: LysR family transcriptional regulator [Alphaproteobacteria bacterium]|nr:MAG: LysR family transcriptional regulator [Alphaproteobacteria bacterium]